MPWRECSPPGRSDWPSEAAVDLGLGLGPVAEPPQLGDDCVEPLALDELHGVEADIPVLAHLEDRHDVGVVQPGRGPGLAAEPLLVIRSLDTCRGRTFSATRRPSETCSAS